LILYFFMLRCFFDAKNKEKNLCFTIGSKFCIKKGHCYQRPSQPKTIINS